MASLNKVLLIGNLTRDPQLRYTPSGTPVADVRLAVNRNWIGQDGQKHEETTFVDVTIWSKQAERAAEFLSKGKPVFIEGRLKFDQWDTPEGQRRSKLSVVAEQWQFVGPRESSGGGRSQAAEEAPGVAGSTYAAPGGGYAGPGEPPAGGTEPSDDEIPF